MITVFMCYQATGAIDDVPVQLFLNGLVVDSTIKNQRLAVVCLKDV
jgi:hypothetical protein